MLKHSREDPFGLDHYRARFFQCLTRKHTSMQQWQSGPVFVPDMEAHIDAAVTAVAVFVAYNVAYHQIVFSSGVPYRAQHKWVLLSYNTFDVKFYGKTCLFHILYVSLGPSLHIFLSLSPLFFSASRSLVLHQPLDK